MVRLSALALSLLALASASPAVARPFQVQGTLSLRIVLLDPLPPPGQPTVETTLVSTPVDFGPESMVTAMNPLSRVSVPAGAFAATGLVVDVTDPAAAPISGLVFTFSNLAGQPLGNAMPLVGVAKICLFFECDATAEAPFNVSVPLDAVGATDTAFASNFVNVTVIGAPWTADQLVLPTASLAQDLSTGTVEGPSGMVGTTTLPGGVVNLVTPIMISTSIPAFSSLNAFGRLELTVVPEPGLLAAQAVALLALVALGVRRLPR